MKNYEFYATFNTKYRVIFILLTLVMIALVVFIVSLSITYQSTPFLISYRPSFKELILLVIPFFAIYKGIRLAMLNQPVIALSKEEVLFHNNLLLRQVLRTDMIENVEHISSKYNDKVLIKTKNGKSLSIYLQGTTSNTKEVYQKIKNAI